MLYLLSLLLLLLLLLVIVVVGIIITHLLGNWFVYRNLHLVPQDVQKLAPIAILEVSFPGRPLSLRDNELLIFIRRFIFIIIALLHDAQRLQQFIGLLSVQHAPVILGNRVKGIGNQSAMLLGVSR